MTAYYNEIDPKKAAALQALMDDGIITAGHIDTRDIREVTADDIKGYKRCHWFAGIGCWDFALQIAGVGPDESVWTGSCPCPPFSSAGKKKFCPECSSGNLVCCPRRTGYFICCSCRHAWLADPRHLWPEFWRIIRDSRPDKVYGEQVSSADGRLWFAGVRASLEILAYGSWGTDACSAGLGSPNIRQRIYWVADAQGVGCDKRSGTGRGDTTRERCREAGGHSAGHQVRSAGTGQGLGNAESNGRSGRTDDEDKRRRKFASRCTGEGIDGVEKPASDGRGKTRSRKSSASGEDERLGEPNRIGSQGSAEAGIISSQGRKAEERSTGFSGRIIHPFWADYDIVLCREPDGAEKYRRIKPGTFPLAHGYPERVGVLHSSGDAINPWLAAEFIKADREALA